MLRHEMVVYGRPVYYSEYGDQYLYWVSTDKEDTDVTASQAAAQRGENSWASNDQSTPDVLQQSGAWVISTSMISVPTSPETLAYCTDPGSTPAHISADSKWHVRAGKGSLKVMKVQLRKKFLSSADDADAAGASSSGMQEATGAAAGAASAAVSAGMTALSDLGRGGARTLQAARGST